MSVLPQFISVEAAAFLCIYTLAIYSLVHMKFVRIWEDSFFWLDVKWS